MRPKELTVRGLVLGALITTVFTAANIYLGLKIGLTFASSIPAAVISMALLSMVRDSSSIQKRIAASSSAIPCTKRTRGSRTWRVAISSSTSASTASGK